MKIAKKSAGGKQSDPPPKNTGMDASDGELITTSRLATLFGINRKTIPQWRKEGKDVPEKIDGQEPLTEWREWFASHPEAGHSDGKPRKDRETLLCEKLEIEIALKKIELDSENGLLVSRADCRAAWTRLGAAVSKALQAASRQIPQACLGLPISQSLPIARLAMGEIQRMLSDAESEFWQDHKEVVK